MNTAIRISFKMFMIIFLLSNLNAFSLQNPTEGGSDVQFIAVHIGNIDNMSILDKTAFPDFEFYSNDAELILYTEAQRIMGNPKYLTGFYGEVPEKMGFCANYTEKKYYGAPYLTGALYVIDPNNIIGYQSNPNYGSIDYEKIRKAVRRFKKGKYAKALKAKKQKYLKESPIGQREKTKGSDIDKDGNGLLGWNVPDINLKDENGASIKLKNLTDGKITVLVFFTLNGAHYKKANAKGVIEKEWDGITLKVPENTFEKEFTEGEYADKSAAIKGFGKALLKTAAASKGGLFAEILLDKEELTDQGKMAAYTEAVELISKSQDMAKALKK